MKKGANQSSPNHCTQFSQAMLPIFTEASNVGAKALVNIQKRIFIGILQYRNMEVNISLSHLVQKSVTL